MVTHPASPASLSAHTRALNITAVPMCCAPASPMSLFLRLCASHHAGHHTNVHHTVNKCVHRTPPCTPTQHFTNHAPPAYPQTHHATVTRCTHKHHALEARQSRVPPHSRRDVLCSRIADGVVAKAMCASTCPPPHKNIHITPSTHACTAPSRVHTNTAQHTTKYAPPAQPQTHHATVKRCTHTNTTHVRLVRVVFRPTAVAMCCAPAAPMELFPRLCVRHHHTQTCTSHSQHMRAPPTPRAHEHFTSPTTRLPRHPKHTTPRPRGTHIQTRRT